MASTLGELLKKLQSEAESKVSARMADGEALFNLEQTEQAVASKWSRDASGVLQEKQDDGSIERFEASRKIVRDDDLVRCVEATNDAQLSNCAIGDTIALESALILQKLGFKVVEKQTTLGKLKLVESVENWRQRNELKDAPVAQPRAVALSAKQIGSTAIENLRRMVKDVNMNPSVLNKGWKAPKKGADYKPPVGPTPSSKTPPPPAFSWAQKGGANVEGEVEAINNVIKSDSYAIKLGAGLESAQLGGGEKEYALSLDQIDDKAVFALRRAYHDLRARLESRGKQLDDSDQKTIEEQLQKFEDSHRRLLLSVELLRAMNDLVERGLITKDKIPTSEVYEKQHHLLKRVEDRKRKVMVILSSLGTAVALEAPSPAPVSAPAAVGSELPVSLEDLVVEV